MLVQELLQQQLRPLKCTALTGKGKIATRKTQQQWQQL